MNISRKEFREVFCKCAAENGMTPSEYLAHVKSSNVGVGDLLGALKDWGIAYSLASLAAGSALGYGGAQLYNRFKADTNIPLPEALDPSQEELHRELIRRYRAGTSSAKQITKAPEHDTGLASSRFSF